MRYVCKTVVIVFVAGKRTEIAPGDPLPAGVDDDALGDLIRLRAVEPAPSESDPEPPADPEPQPEPEKAPEPATQSGRKQAK